MITLFNANISGSSQGRFQGKKRTNTIKEQPLSNVQKQQSRGVVKTGKNCSLNV